MYGHMNLLLFFLAVLSTFLQSEESCDTLVTDFSQKDCIAKQSGPNTYYYWLDESKSCIPTCEKYKPDGHFGDKCPCPPGYSCAKRCTGTRKDKEISCKVKADCINTHGGRRSNCVDMCVVADSCMAYYANTTDFRLNKFTALKFKPNCDDAGNWEAKQCKGGVDGRCYCYDKTGKRLFGQALYADSKDMTCECSRKKADLKNSGRYFVALHCDSMGNYEPLQCDSGLCWCVEPKTGHLTAPVVTEKAMTKLPCYDVSKVGSQYLRQCDSVEYAMSAIEHTFNVHGVLYANLERKLCDGDGAYGAYNISNGIAYCTWRDGSKIDTWQSDSSTDISKLNCNCARDHKMYSTQLSCDGTGNYMPVQNIISNDVNKYFCVDEDGFQKTNFFPEKVENCSAYY